MEHRPAHRQRCSVQRSAGLPPARRTPGPWAQDAAPTARGEKQSRAAGQAALLPQPLMAISWISDLSGRLASSSPSREPTQTDPSPIRGWRPGSSTIPPYTPSSQAPPPPPRPPVTSPSFPPVIQPPSSAVSPSPRSNPAAPGSFSLNILFSSAPTSRSTRPVNVGGARGLLARCRPRPFLSALWTPPRDSPGEVSSRLSEAERRLRETAGFPRGEAG